MTRVADLFVAENVQKDWGGNLALSDVSVVANSGITGLLGANGAGKTTLIGMLLGFHAPTSGALTVMGLDPQTQGAVLRASVGYSPEHALLPDEMQAYEFVHHLARVRGIPKDEARGRASDALFLVGLGEERNRPIGTMSTGQKQRVKLAQAIAHDPSFVLLDEPTDGLDPVQREQMLELIGQVSKDFGIDVLLSSHQLEEVEKVCDNIIVISDGVVALDGPLADLAEVETGLELRLDSQVETVSEALVAKGLEVDQQGFDLTITGMEQLDLEIMVRDVLAELGAPLRKLGPRTKSLEDLFLAAGTYD